MATLLMRLAGPMQSWGTRSRFDNRDTDLSPSKSGVLGLICSAKGIDRNNFEDLKPISKLRFGVRADCPGVLKYDFQTSQNILSANRKTNNRSSLSKRYYLADALFLVGLEGDVHLLEDIQRTLKNPRWHISLGRKSYPPSEPIWLSDGLQDLTLEEALAKYPYLKSLDDSNVKSPKEFQYEIESTKPTLDFKRDQPISSFKERKFGCRYCYTTFVKEGETP